GSDAASAVAVNGAGSNLTLSAIGHDILMKGSVRVGGVTNLNASVLQIDNAANDFNAVALSGPAVLSLNDANDLNLAASNLAFGPLGLTSRITAGGNITQSGPLTISATQNAVINFSSAIGSITLNNAGNFINSVVGVGLSVTGSNT